jgi:hypothetical protein
MPDMNSAYADLRDRYHRLIDEYVTLVGHHLAAPRDAPQPEPKSETPFDDLCTAYHQVHNDAIDEALAEIEAEMDMSLPRLGSARARILALKRTRP